MEVVIRKRFSAECQKGNVGHVIGVPSLASVDSSHVLNSSKTSSTSDGSPATTRDDRGTIHSFSRPQHILLPHQEEHNEPGAKDQHTGPRRSGALHFGLLHNRLLPDFFRVRLPGNVLLKGLPVLYNPRAVRRGSLRIEAGHADQKQRERDQDQTRPDRVEARRGSRAQVGYGDRQPGEVREHQKNAARYRRGSNPPHKGRNLHPPLLSPDNLHAPNLAGPRYEPVTRSVTKAQIRRICAHGATRLVSTLRLAPSFVSNASSFKLSLSASRAAALPRRPRRAGA